MGSADRTGLGRVGGDRYDGVGLALSACRIGSGKLAFGGVQSCRLEGSMQTRQQLEVRELRSVDMHHGTNSYGKGQDRV